MQFTAKHTRRWFAFAIRLADKVLFVWGVGNQAQSAHGEIGIWDFDPASTPVGYVIGYGSDRRIAGVLFY
jgi:hypothetical protein